MAKPFDATTKQIVEVDPQDWLELIGLPRLALGEAEALLIRAGQSIYNCRCRTLSLKDQS